MSKFFTGRKILFILTVGITLVLLFLLRWLGAETIWRAWAVPTKAPGFADLRDVLQGIDAARAAVNSNQFDLVGGYPQIWSVLGALGITASQTPWLAIGIFFLFWFSLFIFARGYDSITAMWMTIVVFSPAVMLGYERGNLDLVMFSLLAVALALDSFSRVLSVGLIVLAAMLKIYPIVALGYLLKELRNKFFVLAGAGLAVFAVYALSIGRSLKGIVGYIPRGALFDYGAEVIGFRVSEVGGPRVWTDALTLISYLALYVLMLVVLYWSYKVSDPSAVENAPFMNSFRLGAIIYLVTFIEGNSFNYRLVFLLFCIPQIWLWARLATPIHFGARIAFVALIASCWSAILLHILPENIQFIIDEIFNWTLLAGLLYLFFVTLPDWLLTEINGFFKRYRIGMRRTS